MNMAGIMRRIGLRLFQGYFLMPTNHINTTNIGIGTTNAMESRPHFLSRNCPKNYFGTRSSLGLSHFSFRLSSNLNSNINLNSNFNNNAINNTNIYLIINTNSNYSNNNEFTEFLFNKEHQMAFDGHLLNSPATVFDGFAINYSVFGLDRLSLSLGIFPTRFNNSIISNHFRTNVILSFNTPLMDHNCINLVTDSVNKNSTSVINDLLLFAPKTTPTSPSSLISIFATKCNNSSAISRHCSKIVLNFKLSSFTHGNHLFMRFPYDNRLFKPATVAISVYGDEDTHVDRMELKKRLYKSYKSRKLSNPSTKSRRRHMQSNR